MDSTSPCERRADPRPVLTGGWACGESGETGRGGKKWWREGLCVREGEGRPGGYGRKGFGREVWGWRGGVRAGLCLGRGATGIGEVAGDWTAYGERALGGGV